MTLDDFTKDMSFSLSSGDSIMNYFNIDSLGDLVLSPAPYIGFSGKVDLTIELKDAIPIFGNKINLAQGRSATQYVSLQNTRVENVTVNYIDENRNSIMPSKTLGGDIGESYSIDIPDITGYEYSSTEGNLQGEFSLNDRVINIIYKQAIFNGNVKVNYVDKDQKELSPTETISGPIGEDYKLEAKTIKNYKLVEVVGNTEGKFSFDSQEVSFVYQEDIPVETGLITQHFYDIEDNKIKDSIAQEAVVGTNYSLTTEEITGYSLVEVRGNTTGKVTKEPIDVYYIYQQDVQSNDTGQVNVSYVDENGKALANPERYTGIIGNKFKIKTKKIKGYQVKEIIGNLEGSYQIQAQDIKIVYKEIEGLPDTGISSGFNWGSVLLVGGLTALLIKRKMDDSSED